MKRILCILLVLLCFCGCARQEHDSRITVMRKI